MSNVGIERFIICPPQVCAVAYNTETHLNHRTELYSMSSIFVNFKWLQKVFQPADVTLSDSKTDSTFYKIRPGRSTHSHDKLSVLCEGMVLRHSHHLLLREALFLSLTPLHSLPILFSHTMLDNGTSVILDQSYTIRLNLHGLSTICFRFW